MLPDLRVRQRDYLLEISRAMTQELNPEKLLGRIIEISLEMLVGQAGMIALRSDLGGWHVQVSKGLPASFVHSIQPHLASLQDYQHTEIQEIPEINRWLVEFATSADLGIYSGVGLPLIARQKGYWCHFRFPHDSDPVHPKRTKSPGEFCRSSRHCCSKCPILSSDHSGKAAPGCTSGYFGRWHYDPEAKSEN